MSYVVALLALVTVVLVVLVLGLLRSHAEILRALHDVGAFVDGRPDPVAAAGGHAGHDHGTQRPPQIPPTADRPGGVPSHLTGVSATGEPMSVPTASSQPTLLAFLTSGCVTCSSFWDALRSRGGMRGMRTVIVTRGPDAESPAAVGALAPPGVTTVMSSEAWEEFGVPGAPYFVHLDGDLVAGEGVASHWDQLLTMLGRSHADGGGGVGHGDDPAMSRRQLLKAGRDRRRSDRAVGGA